MPLFFRFHPHGASKIKSNRPQNLNAGRTDQQRITILLHIHRMVFLAGVLVLPMLADGVGDFNQPSAVFGQFQHVGSGKKLDAVLRRIAQRLEQPSVHECRNIMRLAVQHPARLLRRQAGGQLIQE